MKGVDDNDTMPNTKSKIARRRRLYILVGIPGSGKTTYARAELATCLRVSLDDMRLMLTGNSFNPRYESLVAEIGNASLDIVMRASRRRGYDIVFDVTSVSRRWRSATIRRAVSNDLDPHCIFFDIPLSVALQRNRARSNPVPEAVVARFFRQLEPPTLDEGFLNVTVVAQR